ncbi:hypothetical protein BOH78_1313 [Pichia kudriavzevii]|uniref:Uncharacterized protein n=1 Tax=Pichia kudriavzevii TaxID=4909 RepID=A0A1V2LR72_PICKU|nr:hypothetical protein BOH78_1313 [Pichia kudriavzevii]
MIILKRFNGYTMCSFVTSAGNSACSVDITGIPENIDGSVLLNTNNSFIHLV